MSFRDHLGKQLLFFDGAMGTMLQSSGLQPGEKPELWSLEHPETVKAIHRAYLRAGANILKTNSFGCNALKLPAEKVEFAAKKAVEIAREAIREEGGSTKNCPRFVAMDMGPTGKLLSPLGDLDFETAVELFKTPLAAGAAAGADLILLETFSDAYELKAAVLAAKEAAPELPICASVTLDKRGRLLTGGDIGVVVCLLEGLRVDALGLNCGLGPKEMLPLVDALVEKTSLPLFLNPNAGLPQQEDGKTYYDVGLEDFALLMEAGVRKGLWLAGGCCGTSPAYIKALTERCAAILPPKVEKKTRTVVCSYSTALEFSENGCVLIGERINPTGKPRMKAALREGNIDLLIQEGIREQEVGAEALDVNVGLPEINEPEMLTRIVKELQAVCDLPLQIDTADPIAMEKALRIYNGKAILNSVSGKEAVMDAIFPLMAKYGAVAVALTLDDTGIPETADGRIAIAKRILERAKEYGISKEAFLFDPLTMAVSAGSENAKVTLDCVRRLRQELGVKVSLGVSNVSFGLPGRERLNSAFFTMAMLNGLNAAIMNPFSGAMMDAYRTANALLGRDAACASYIDAYASETAAAKTAEPRDPAAKKVTAAAANEGSLSLHDAVLKGLKQQAAESAQQDRPPMELIEEELIPALNEAGLRFEKGTLFLPQLLMCADAAKAAFEVIRCRLPEGEGQNRGTVILATVEGDVHDIGKNIVKALLENYCFKVLDLGKDVCAEKVLQAVLETKARLVGLSALMTTTVPGMARTIQLLRKESPETKIMCGGAVLTEAHTLSMGADRYVADAMASVRYAMELFEK